jgi:hypothetical protein
MTARQPANHRHQRIRESIADRGEWKGDYAKLLADLGDSDPETLQSSGQAYSAAAKRFARTADLLRKYATVLANAWNSDDSIAAQRQLQRLFATTQDWSERSATVGAALTQHGSDLEWFRRNLPIDDNGRILRGTEKWDGYTKKDIEDLGLITKNGFLSADKTYEFATIEAAQRHMNYLNSFTFDANNKAMPEHVTTDLPETGTHGAGSPPSAHPPQAPGSGHGAGSGGGSGGSPGGGAGRGSIPTGGGGSPVAHGGGSQIAGPHPYASPASTPPVPSHGHGGLSGLPSGGPGGGGSDPFGRGGLGGLGGGSQGGVPGFGGAGAAGGGGGGIGGLPTTTGGRPGNSPRSVPGSGGKPGDWRGAKSAGGGAASGRSAKGMAGGAPVGAGSGGGQGEKDKERETWLAEDPSVWGGDDEDTSPPVLG